MLTAVGRTLVLHKGHLTSIKPVSVLGFYLHKHYSQPKLLLTMNEAFIKHEKDAEVFNVTFRYVDPNIKLDRQFNFNRSINESIKYFLQRIDANLSKRIIQKTKRRKKNKDAPEEEPMEQIDNVANNNIQILRNNSALDLELPCKVILESPSDVKLVIFDSEYIVKLNTPSIITMSLPTSILAGFPTYPSKFECAYTDKQKSTFEWYSLDMLGKNQWEQVGQGYIYIPDVSQIGNKLKLMCLPRNNTQTGPPMEVESKSIVDSGPGSCLFDSRHVFTANKLSGKSFRVVSYNILADIYAQTDYSKEVLYPYCAPYALTIDYRKLLILKELIGYNSDIICLQEVDKKVFDHDLLPSLSALNYDGIYNSKNDLSEGLTTLFNADRFDILNSECSALSQNTDLEGFDAVWSKIENENVKERFKGRSTVVQVITLQSKENPSEILVVANTHLYFRPDADNIRLLQAYCGLTYVRRAAKQVKEKKPECNVSIIFCGDFNSCPENGVYQLMTKKYIPEDFADWKSNPEEIVENVSLHQDICFSSACGTPEYTNYTTLFAGCLDYIFYQCDRLEVEQVIPFPSKEELSLYSGLPSVVAPSDHISLCADLKWSK